MDVGLEPVSRNRLSDLVKTIVVVESIGLAMLGFWLEKEYQNNVYLQQYVHNTAWTYLPVLAFIATFTVAVGASEAYSRVGGRNVGSTPVEPSTPHGLLLTGGFQTAPSNPSQGSNAALMAGHLSDTVDWTPPGVSFARVFEESRPPTVLKHVKPDETLDTYTPPTYPVIKRLKPAGDPVESETPKPIPRPLNRVGMAPGFAIPSPPVIRQIRRPAGTGNSDDQLRNNTGAVNEDSPRESTKSVKPQPIKKKPVFDDDLANDFSGE